MGFEQGDIFCMVAKNSQHLAPILYASICIACPVNALDPSFTKREMIHMFSITKPRAIFCDAEVFEKVQECLIELGNDAKIFTFNESVENALPVEDLFEESPEEKTFS